MLNVVVAIYTWSVALADTHMVIFPAELPNLIIVILTIAVSLT